MTYICSGSLYGVDFWNTIWQQKIQTEHRSLIEMRKQDTGEAKEAEMIRKMYWITGRY